jgi:hypothetical protein
MTDGNGIYFRLVVKSYANFFELGYQLSGLRPAKKRERLK